MTKIRLDWKNLFSPPMGQFSVGQDNDVRIERLKERYTEIFKPELGTVVGVTAKLHLKEDATPVFQRARPVPYVLRSAVEEELKRMEVEGVLKPVEVSDWATPIVCVPKTDGSVRICGDYKGTVNPAIQTEQFPIPTLEKIRGRVSTWKKFTKIDLRSAYQQLVLDEELQELCTINTHKGLFRYTRLPFGISSSPAIWQRFIEQVLAGLDGTCVIMDDLLVGGTNDDDRAFEEFRSGFQAAPEVWTASQTTEVCVHGTICDLLWIALLRKGTSANGRKGQGHQGRPYPTQCYGIAFLPGNGGSTHQFHSKVINPRSPPV